MGSIVDYIGLMWWYVGDAYLLTLVCRAVSIVDESLVVTLTAFHRRSFVATAMQPGNPRLAVATIEMVVSLLIEFAFIATARGCSSPNEWQGRAPS